MLRFWDRLAILYSQAIGLPKTQEDRHMPTENRKPANLPKLTREQLTALAKEHGIELEDEK